MKRIITCFLLIFLLIPCFLFCVTDVSADKSGFLEYKKVNDQIIITNCDEKISGNLVIPSTIEGCPVTVIDDYAFSLCKLLTSITIPESVVSIGRDAFYYCEILETVVIPTNVTKIEEGAFGYCDSLTSVTIPSSVKEISSKIFQKCENLRSVTISDGVRSIGTEAFYDCENLEYVSIGKDVVKIENAAFGSCDKLSNIDISEENQSFCVVDRVLYSKDMTTLIQCFASKEDIVRIPDGVICIKKEAFIGCDKILSVILPEGLEVIEEYAFEACSLSAIALPDSLLAIGNHAFNYCSDLTMVVIPNQITTINEYTFSYCEALVSVGIPMSVTTIGEGAFFLCENLTQVNYVGEEESWKTIACGKENTHLKEATKNYNYYIKEMNDIPELSPKEEKEKNGISSAVFWMVVGGVISLISSFAVRKMRKDNRKEKTVQYD